MKIWKFTLRRSSGVKTHSDKVCLSSPFPGQFLRKWNHATQTLRSPTREHQKQHRHLHLRCVLLSPHLHQFRHDLQQQAISPGFPDSPRTSPQEISLQGHMEVDRKAKWVLAEPTTDSVSAWDELISSCRITLFSDIPWNSNTWLSIGGDYQSLNTYSF